MNLNLTRMLSLVLAFGFFISCTSTNPLVTDSIDEMDTPTLRSTSEELLSENPLSISGNHLAGIASYREARELQVADRPERYAEMASRFEVALGGARDANARNHILATQLRAWEYEFGEAQRYYSEDASSQNALDHARNATIIQPDSLGSFVLASRILVAQGNLEEATSYLHHAVTQGSAADIGHYFETYAFLQARQGDYLTAANWYQRSINWMQTYDGQSLRPTGNDISRGSLLNAFHGAINTLSEAGQTEQAIVYLELLSSRLDDNGIYLEMLIVQYFNTIRSTALDSYGSISMETLEENIQRIRRTVDANPSATLFAAAEFVDLASGHVDLQHEISSNFDPATDATLNMLLEEARSLFERHLQEDPESEEAIYGMASTFSLVGNEAEAGNWLELLD